MILVLYELVKALETGLIQFKGALGFIGLSFAAGFVFQILADNSIESPNRPKPEGDNNG